MFVGLFHGCSVSETFLCIALPLLEDRNVGGEFAWINAPEREGLLSRLDNSQHSVNDSTKVVEYKFRHHGRDVNVT